VQKDQLQSQSIIEICRRARTFKSLWTTFIWWQ